MYKRQMGVNKNGKTARLTRVSMEINKPFSAIIHGLNYLSDDGMCVYVCVCVSPANISFNYACTVHAMTISDACLELSWHRCHGMARYISAQLPTINAKQRTVVVAEGNVEPRQAELRKPSVFARRLLLCQGQMFLAAFFGLVGLRCNTGRGKSGTLGEKAVSEVGSNSS